MSRARLVLAAAAMLLLAGCSRPAAYVVLLDQPDGSPSAVTWTNHAGKVVVDKPGSGTGADSAEAKPADLFALTKDDIDKTFGAALKAQPTRPKTFLLYFEFSTADLTKESQALLPKVLDEVKLRAAPDVGIIGHTDSMGDARFNYDLALKRAQSVEKKVLALGIDPKLVEVESHGGANPLVPEVKGKGEPRNRRVEVTVR
jgi:peptidoglycan-associated lipoprotein